MSVVKFTTPSNSLRSALQSARPSMAHQAIERANTNLLNLKSECEDYIDGLMMQLSEVVAARDVDAHDRLAAIYQLAVRFIGVSSLAGLIELEHAARSLCDVADGLLERGLSDEEPIRVHVESMRLLRHPAALGAQREMLADGLRQVRARYAPPAGADETA